MITKERLIKNLKTLKDTLPGKPSQYTDDYPKTIKDALSKYSNKRSVNALENNTHNLNKLNWPLPLWVNPDKIDVGFWNEYYWKKWVKSWDKKQKYTKPAGFYWLWIPVFGNTFSNNKIDSFLVEIFDINLKYIENKILNNPLLVTKRSIIIDVFLAYKSKNYSASISTLFPIIDFVIRKFIATESLTTSVTKVCKLFSECGFDLEKIDYLMPSIALEKYIYSEGVENVGKKIQSAEFSLLAKQVEKNKYGIIGAALNSFLLFSNNYYARYMNDTGDHDIINRHAILHGSVNAFNTKINAVKLFTYFFLILELEPIFNILFDEN
ncbi:MAG: hypothetical protein JST50_15700 [Bacteroidetes bacterium]|jgi:hypothetical protein|nr:hypothetical protein [Bacteroidota bacterium]